MTSRNTRARGTAPRWWAVALAAGVLVWVIASATRVVVAFAQGAPQQQSANQSAQPKTAPDQAAGQPAAQDQKKKNRFESIEEEDEKAAEPKKNRFASLDEQDDKGAKKDTAAQPAGQRKNRFALDDEDEQKELPAELPKGPYTGTAKCVRCHAKQGKAYFDGPHGKDWDRRSPASDIGCETCHGPGLAHDLDPGAKGLVKMPPKMSPREATALCLTCHERQHAGWQGSQHDARNITCVNCHSVHKAKSERGHLKGETVDATCAPCHRDKAARLQRSAHMPVREGKMECSTCHDPHGSSNVRLLRTGNTINESCLSCHAEKRGPFLWDHAPVAEKCSTCHDPHGSFNNRMLIAKDPMLCQRCHIGTRHPATPYDGAQLLARSNRLVNRGCVNCHQVIHGSNHPSGQFFQR